MDKAVCKQRKTIGRIIQERSILVKLNSPFICSLRYAFQDETCLYLAMDFKPGLDLPCFIVAQVASAIAYIHSHQIVHRNVRPENLLLDENGHAFLTDFRMASYYDEKTLMYVTTGTLGYMAPEMLKKCGYTHTIDWWSLGIVLFEMLYGKRPFRGKKEENIKKSILSGKITFPPNPTISSDCVHVIKGFLKDHSPDRLGDAESGGFAKLKTLKWFTSINWTDLGNQSAKAPFKPKEVHLKPAIKEVDDTVMKKKSILSILRKPSIAPLETEQFLPFDHAKTRGTGKKPWNNWLNAIHDNDESLRQLALPVGDATASSNFIATECDSNSSLKSRNSSGSDSKEGESGDEKASIDS
ncbi:kinase-like domain-containing protein [Obelidium mucronatum]|nr:kinase-like domain-containing protein [Obelidium mucronatum]